MSINSTLKKEGIHFYSTSIHRFKINFLEPMLVGNVLYLKRDNKLIIISNVSNVQVYNEYLYFSCLGKVKIYLNLTSIYRYFSIKIKSQKFNIEVIRQQAIVDFVNNSFDENFSKILNRYVKIIQNVLNIHIFSEKILIQPNEFRLPFELTYKLNKRIKHIKINSKL